MLAEAPNIPLTHLVLAALPCLLLLGTMLWQQLPTDRIWLGLGRMVTQLLLIGYVLQSIFSAGSPWILFLAMILMTIISAWIAAGSIPGNRHQTWGRAILAIGLSGSLVAAWTLFLVLGVSPGNLRTAIPLAGMIYANSINSVSIAGERFATEWKNLETSVAVAKRHAFAAAMIPVTNSLLAVGVVSIPGMMTGQILAGADPQIAARYQIMVMLMLLSSSGLSALLFLALESRNKEQERQKQANDS